MTASTVAVTPSPFVAGRTPGPLRTRPSIWVRRRKGDAPWQPNPAARPDPIFPYLQTAEVANILQVTPKTVSRWAKEGKLPFLTTLGGHRRYPAAEIRQLADQLQVRPTA